MNPNFSVISRAEVIAGMKTAKNSKLQKKIFADLCSCTVADIEKILKEDEMANFFTAADIEYIKQAVEEGKTNREIGDHLGRDYRSIEQKIYMLRKQGEMPSPRRRNAYTAQAPAASEVRIIRPAGPIESPTTQDPEAEHSIEYYKSQLAAAETALKNVTEELLKERAAHAELRILAQMIAKAAAI